MHFVNGAQFLNSSLSLASPRVAVIFPVPRICAPEKSQRFDLKTLVSNLTFVLPVLF